MPINIKRIKNEIDKNKDFLRKEYNVKNLGVFGSVARGDNTMASDIDLLVEFVRPIGLFKFIELEQFLSKSLGGKVEIVTKNALKPQIKEEILQEVVYV